ncbi:MAG TPA: TonB-dependent receptor [Rhodanobacter sp.]|nr:TonB-dependent receptor [Rhodanobacter sp.]
MAIRNHRRQLLALSIVVAFGAIRMPLAHAQEATTTGDVAAPQASQATDAKKTTTLSEITVHAQKRVELLQNVPITMTTLSRQQLHDAGVEDIKDLQNVVSGLSVTNTSSESQTTARIRGIGTVGDNPGLESSVGITIDGVPRPRNGVAFGDLGELEQIEVLKGPQGTVFGKNTSAGEISITTKRPEFKQEGYAELTLGNYGETGVDAAYNDAIGKHVAFRLYAVDRKHDGYDNVNVAGGPRTLGNDGDQDFHSVRGQLLIEPSDNVNILLIGDYTKRDENCCVGVTLVRGPTAAIVDALSAGGQGVIDTVDPSRRLAYGNDGTRQTVTDEGISSELNWTTPWLGNALFTSISSVRKWDGNNSADLDYSGAPIWSRQYSPDHNYVRFHTWTQELRLTGSTDHFDWLGGLYFEGERLDRNDSITLGSAYEPYLSIALLNSIASSFPAGLVDTSNAATFLSQASGLPYGAALSGVASNDTFHQNSTSSAAFGNVTFHATDKLDITVGTRFTHQEKTLDSYYSRPNGGYACGAGLSNPNGVAGALAARGVPAAYLGAITPTVIGYMCLPWSNVLFDGLQTTQKLDANEWSGTAKASYRWTPDVMTYLSAARGYKAGGFNLDSEQSGNGLSDGPAGILPVTNTSFPGEFVDSYELGTKTTWADGNLLLDMALFKSDYTNFQLNSFLGTSYVVRSVPHLDTHGLDVDLLWQTSIPGLTLHGGATWLHARYGHETLPDADLALLPDNTPSFAPTWQAAASVAYQWNMGSRLMGRFNVGAKYTTDYNTGSNLAPAKQQDAFTVIDARFSIGARNKRWSLELWGKNLTNKTYTQVAFDAPIQTGSINAFLGAPRTYGITGKLSF